MVDSGFPFSEIGIRQEKSIQFFYGKNKKCTEESGKWHPENQEKNMVLEYC